MNRTDLGGNASIEQIGPPDKVINAFGPEVIGENVEGKVLSINVAEHSGRTYYQYELEPPHALITATAAGNRLYLFNVTGSGKDLCYLHVLLVINQESQAISTDKIIILAVIFVGLQWKRHYKDLKRIAESFRVV